MLSLAAVAAISLTAQVTAFAVIPDDVHPLHVREIERVCRNVESKNLERCVARQLVRLRAQNVQTQPLEALEFRDEQDWGMNHLRRRMQRERMLENQAYVEATRRTFREFTPVEDHNAQSRPFMNDLKTGQLYCMTEVPPGRPRNLCLDALRNRIRQEMRETRGSMKIIAPRED